MAADCVPQVKWSHTSQQLMLRKHKDLQQEMPCIVRIRDNPFSSHLPDKFVREDLLLHSVVTHRKVVCQCVDFIGKDGQLNFSSQRFSVPLAYTGWLEILSEDGKTVSPVKTIERISEMAVDKFLIRSKIKAFLSNENGKLDIDKTVIVEKGEVMTIVGRLSITHGWRRQKKQIIHCLNFSGQHIYFDIKATGQFSPIASPTSIAGVHSIEGIINQFRLPLTVRIVSGQIPRVASQNNRPGVFRLLETQKDDTALFLPFLSHQRLMPVSVRTNIQLTKACNMLDIKDSQYYKQLLKLCSKKVEKYFRTMQVLVSAKQQRAETYTAFTLPTRRKVNSIKVPTQRQNTLETEEDVLFAEVDDLYAYVRRGGAPPKPRPRSWANHCEDIDVPMVANGMSASQPSLNGENKARGLLAMLTAGKYPTRPSTLTRSSKMDHFASTAQFNTTAALEPKDIPVTKRSDKIRSYIEKYHGSLDSLQTEVDPYVEEAHYKTSNENIISKVKPAESQQQASRPRTLSSSIEIMKTVSPVTSPTEGQQGYKGSICQLVVVKPRIKSYHLSENQSPTIKFLESKPIHRAVRAT
ncbi:uncharacterized protein [Watersipora subatra]|uniref:uncharacterized protein n=1 Tax=Watersipora subatra TaxID=2589382 RepID=UPI00355B888E